MVLPSVFISEIVEFTSSLKFIITVFTAGLGYRTALLFEAVIFFSV
jgi:hypothetical protein